MGYDQSMKMKSFYKIGSNRMIIEDTKTIYNQWE